MFHLCTTILQLRMATLLLLRYGRRGSSLRSNNHADETVDSFGLPLSIALMRNPKSCFWKGRFSKIALSSIAGYQQITHQPYSGAHDPAYVASAPAESSWEGSYASLGRIESLV